MNKYKLSILILIIGITIHAQENEKEILKKNDLVNSKLADTTNIGWKRRGAFTFLFNQTAFNNNWLSGGTTSIAGNVGVNYDINYKKGKIVWDNKIVIDYGLTRIEEQDITKTEDRIELNSLFGSQIKESNWFYSAFLNFKTQMDTGLDPVTKRKNSHFFSPAYIQVGPGFLWKKSNNLKVNIAPATSKLVIVHEHFTLNSSSFGVEKGKTTRFEFGAALNAYYKLNLMENISMENTLNLYANYLDHPQNVDLDYQMNLVMKINKYISSSIEFQAIYDDNAIGAFQIREVFGLGLNYTF